jgi:hypothetical protein
VAVAGAASVTSGAGAVPAARSTPPSGDPQGTIYVADSGSNQIDVFPPGAHGNVAPERVISGPDTGLNTPGDVKVNAAGEVFASNFAENTGTSSITVYAPQASGDASPICTITGPDTGLLHNDDMSIEPDGTLVVGNFQDAAGDPGAITVYPAGSCGDVAPVRTIAGSSTGFNQVDGVGADAAGTIFAASTQNDSIQVFAPGSNGNVAPEFTISGASSHVDKPDDVVVGFDGKLYVSNGFNATVPSVTVYAPGAQGNAAPLADIAGSSTLMQEPDDLAVDSAGAVYVTDASAIHGPAVLEWTAGATGNVAPNALLQGASTTFNAPEGVFVSGPPTSSSATLATAVAAKSIALGDSTSDTATLSGGSAAPTGSLVFKLFGPNDPACSSAPAFTSAAVTVNGDGSYNSPSFKPTAAGTYSWQDEYSGDAHNAAATSPCNDPNETVAVGVSPVTVTTDLLFGDGGGAVSLTVPAGSTVNDQATLTGTSAVTGTVTGTITYNVYSDPACTQLVNGGSPEPISEGGVPLSQDVTLDTPGTYYWQAVYSGDSANAGASSTCGPSGEVETVQPGEIPISLATTLAGGGKSGAVISVPAGTAVTDTVTASGDDASKATGAVTYNVYSDAACTKLVSAGSAEAINPSTPGTFPPSQVVALSAQGTYYWQASYTGDANNAAATSTCGTSGEVETVTPGLQPTTTTTSLSGGGKSGVKISVVAGTPVTDTGTLSGANASAATGTVTYTVYSDAACTKVAASAGSQAVAGGVMPPSSAVALTTAGTFYWKAAYSGDAENGASASTCGTTGEVETVTPPPPATSLATALAGGGHTGAKLLVPSGQPASDVATLSGTNAAKATGTVTFSVFSDSKCTKLVVSQVTKAITAGKATSAAQTLPAGMYFWTASYSGDAANRASSSPCGSEVLTVKAAAGKPGTAPNIDTVTTTSATTAVTAKVSSTVAGDLVVAFVAGNGPANRHQTATVSGGGMTWFLISRQNAPGNDSEVWAALPSGKLSGAAITVRGSISGFEEVLMIVAFKNATGIGPEAFAHATSGAPKGTLKTTVANSWVFGLGSDWRRFAARTPGAGQFIFAQGGPPAKVTAWIQAPADATPKAGTTVTISDTAPAADPFNLLLVAIQ